MKLRKAAGVMIVLFTGLKKWFHARSTIFVDVNNSMTVMQEETFGPRKPWSGSLGHCQ
jgi:acyl-CoA reductase-like NAD-dependent aldehyde dehydrogenase